MKKKFILVLFFCFLQIVIFGDDIKVDGGTIIPQGEIKGKIGVLIESHFDEQEYSLFRALFPKNGYQVDFVSYLWGNNALTFEGNDLKRRVEVNIDITKINPSDYKGIILIGGYAMDRLRYSPIRKAGERNKSPAVEFLRKSVAANIKIGTICHSLWLFTAAPDLLKGKKVTCAHNIIDDVENAGGIVAYKGEETETIVVDGNIISAQHPDYTKKFITAFINEIEKK